VLALGAESGPLHLAATQGTPTLRLYGTTDPRLFGPWAPDAPARHRLARVQLPCSPCGHLVDPPCGARATPACMLGIQAAQVLAEQALLPTSG
jgi:ADP-heptose:LPS heptosyltransferase